MARRALLALFPVSAALLLACPASLDDRCAEGACDPRAEADGGAPATPEPTGCTYGAGPSDSPACITDAYAVFVAPTGDNAAEGTKSAPLRTIDAAVGKATASGKPHIYVCTGDYQSSVTITRRLSIFGVACDFVSPAGGNRPRWTGASAAFVAQVTGIQQRVVLADLAIAALDAPATSDGQSSVGVFVADSADVQLVRVDVKAGRGSNGRSGTTEDRKVPAPKGSPGADGALMTGGPGAKITCPDGESTGGTGGSLSGGLATAGLPTLDGGTAGASAGAACATTSLGGRGADGTSGGDAPALSVLGSLTSSGWTPASGAKGQDGSRAQGGGGGATSAGNGGGGGAGGCGGTGGSGGTGGGASIALLAVASSVTITGSTLSGGVAGNGGSGVAGQLGQPGGAGGGGGRPNVGVDGCAGGSGGDGGNGGAGAGGAAGVARAILYKGSKIVKESTTLAAGTTGNRGDGGKPSNAGTVAPTLDQQEL